MATAAANSSLPSLQATAAKAAAVVPAERAKSRKVHRHHWTIGDSFWSWWLTWEGNSSSGMLEPWEKVLLISIISLLSFLFWHAVLFSFPSHIKAIIPRVMYYVTGLGQRVAH
ncbi:hypothetical protein K437DRAFT_260341 [Tilletiaria anomala UBC 951]|uniref:Uncharacterized protein n=1 Tax=Tilletiaria anomala (strain ATCC 24038 / CBS 436.72 / UBC 951) TaxID=1037660 RepID=A0A066V5Q6_TILAU|nr:uncharacterized protein K437DRAFT_260341 [Tilletiaria anomala UBC 951]KDN35583.1 hypothetical protein K437DRAFT_260341 [Tilletiaria anomala UBC 951]